MIQEWGGTREELELWGGKGTEGGDNCSKEQWETVNLNHKGFPLNRITGKGQFFLPPTRNSALTIHDKTKKMEPPIKCKQNKLKKMTKSNLKGHITDFTED